MSTNGVEIIAAKIKIAATLDNCGMFSKNQLTEETLQLLISLANECQLPAAIEAMFNGEKINGTENRSVLHTALRYFGTDPILVDGEDVMPSVRQVPTTAKKLPIGQNQPKK